MGQFANALRWDAGDLFDALRCKLLDVLAQFVKAVGPFMGELKIV